MNVIAANKKIKVLILLDRLVIGGQAVDIIPLAFYLQNAFEVKVLYGQPKSNDVDASFLLQSYPVATQKIAALCKTSNIVTSFKAYTQIATAIRQFQPQIVHTNAVTCGLFARIAAHKQHIPVIIHTYHGHFFHSYFGTFISKILVLAERYLATITHQIIATSKQQVNDLVYKYQIAPIHKVAEIHLGIDQLLHAPSPQKPFKEKYFISDDVIAIGIIARIVKIKNFDLFVEIVANVLHRTTKKVKFFVIGDGNLKKHVQAQLTHKKISWCNEENSFPDAQVIFTSWMHYIADAIDALNIVMLTSNNEGTGLALAESQFCGKPVVATNVGGVNDTIVHNETGFLINPNDATEFAAKLLLLINDATLRAAMGAKAMAFAKKQFSKQSEVASITQLYSALLSKQNIYL